MSDSKYNSFSSYDEALKKKVYRDFSGGMDMDADARRTDAPAFLLNLETEGKRLVSSFAPDDVSFEDGFDEGAVTDSAYADGVLLFRKGRSLYACKNGVFSLVGEKGMLRETSGAIYDYDRCFYLMDGESIYRIDRALTVSLTEPAVPLCFKGMSRSGAYYTEIAPRNPFCRYVDVMLSDETDNEQKFPLGWAVDPTYARAWHPDGREVYPGYMVMREDRIIFDGDDAAGCRLRLRLLDSEDETLYSFSDTAEYRAFLNHPEKVIPISLSGGNTLLLTCKGTEIVGVLLTEDGFSFLTEENFFRYDCLETIMGMASFDEGYLLFFENAVKKLFVTEKGGEIIFSVLPFKNDFGSDMKGSICSFDDKIVFASARGGVSCIDRFGISEKMESRRISGNIEKSFFSHTASEYRDAVGFCAFGKYLLTVGDKTYIWDHRAKLPTGVQSRADEEKMVWSVSDLLKAERYLAFLSGRLYYAERDTGRLCYIENESGTVPFCLRTSALDFDSTDRKTLVSFGIRYRSTGAITLSLSLDGKPYMGDYEAPAAENFETRTFRVYGKRFGTLSLSAVGVGKAEIDALIFQYFS